MGKETKLTQYLKRSSHVVIRHVCHCKTAAEPPADEDKIEHVFTIDGEDFPWYISERGQIVTRVMDDLYVVDVEIIELCKEPGEHYLYTLDFGYTSDRCSVPNIPVIGGVEFPWLLTDDVMTLTFGHKQFPTLHLKFFAESVDANIPIDDQRAAHRDKEIFRNGGELIAKGADYVEEVNL